ncbi:MAG: tripartite tricarboxylate transporter permease [Candidatus Aenigmatarchaeota archaeon]
MFAELVLFLLLGILLGTIAGLVPGLHPNTIAFLLLSAAPLLNLKILPLVALLVGSEIANSFVDFIPSILFSAPEEDSALSVLPGQKFLLMGRGYEAIFLATYGGLASTLIIAVLFPLFVIFIPRFYSLLKPVIVILLLATVAHMLWTSRKKFALSLLVFSLSAAFGLLIFSLPMSGSEVLFPAFCGLFGMASLYFASKTPEVPDQEIDCEVSDAALGKGSLLSVAAGLLAGILPGVGSSQVTVMTQQLAKIGDNLKDFMVTIGGITTASSLFSIVALWTIGNPRSGTSVAIQALDFDYTLSTLFLAVFMIVASAGISALLTLKLSKVAVRNIHRVRYDRLTKIIFASLVGLVALFTGRVGLLVAATGLSIGIFCITTGARRSLMMGVLIVPTLLILAGV